MATHDAIAERAWPARWVSVPRLLTGALLLSLFALALLGFCGVDVPAMIRNTIARRGSATLVVDARAKSFGTVPVGQPIQLSFRLANAGTKQIRIVGCDATCGCILPRDLPLVLEPKQERELTFGVHNLKQTRVGAPRTVDLALDLLTNDSTLRRFPLTIQGTITP
jgi:hypothetical protein